MKTGLLLLAFAATVLGAARSPPLGQYHFEYNPRSWAEARRHCRGQFQELASVSSLQEAQRLATGADLSRIQASGQKYAWIGWFDDVASWRWSMSTPGFYSGEEAAFRHWNEPPNNAYGRENCVEMDPAGTWNDQNCDSLRMSVCCHLEGEDVKFVLVSTTMTWAAAQSYCRQHYTDLASVRNSAENQRVRAVVPFMTFAWIGLFRDSWKWSDGLSSSFRYWESAQPDGGAEACVGANLLNSGRWGDWSCDSQLPFVCYSAPVLRKVVRLSLQGNGSLNLSDSGVQAEALKQVRLRLKEWGVKTEMKLSWRKQKDGRIFQEEEEEEQKEEEEEEEEEEER
ncbi:C-type mannose receptor 2-like [Menidia menidia]